MVDYYYYFFLLNKYESIKKNWPYLTIFFDSLTLLWSEVVVLRFIFFFLLENQNNTIWLRNIHGWSNYKQCDAVWNAIVIVSKKQKFNVGDNNTLLKFQIKREAIMYYSIYIKPFRSILFCTRYGQYYIIPVLWTLMRVENSLRLR